MNRRMREQIEMIEREGGKVLSVRKTGSGHFLYRVGVGERVCSFTDAATPGDWRGDLNIRARVRRAVRGAQGSVSSGSGVSG